MAKGKKTGGRDIQPGQVLNPNGRKSPEDIKTIRSENKFEVERCLSKYLRTSVDQLKYLAKDENLTGLEMACVRLVLRGAGNGDYKVMDFILNRLIGRVKEQIELYDGLEDDKAVIILPSNGREENEN